jgi:hypothetical protein
VLTWEGYVAAVAFLFSVVNVLGAPPEPGLRAAGPRSTAPR